MISLNRFSIFSKYSKDGYKITKINNQIWMAENLKAVIENSFCYYDNNRNCSKYGRLYTYQAASKVCPDGWHIPSIDEWRNLAEFLGGAQEAGKSLKGSKFGFKVPLAGFRRKDGVFLEIDNAAIFWTSTPNQKDPSRMATISLLKDYNNIHFDYSYKETAISMRCIKD